MSWIGQYVYLPFMNRKLSAGFWEYSLVLFMTVWVGGFNILEKSQSPSKWWETNIQGNSSHLQMFPSQNEHLVEYAYMYTYKICGKSRQHLVAMGFIPSFLWWWQCIMHRLAHHKIHYDGSLTLCFHTKVLKYVAIFIVNGFAHHNPSWTSLRLLPLALSSSNQNNGWCPRMGS